MKAINCLILLLLMTLKAQTQNVMTSSPYSMFGIGELQNGLYGQNAGMGGVAYGMRNNVLMNIENPAGLTALDSKRLLTELAIFAKMNRALLKAALIGVYWKFFCFDIGWAGNSTVVYSSKSDSL